jgi:hypothetical protein
MTISPAVMLAIAESVSVRMIGVAVATGFTAAEKPVVNSEPVL